VSRKYRPKLVVGSTIHASISTMDATRSTLREEFSSSLTHRSAGSDCSAGKACAHKVAYPTATVRRSVRIACTQLRWCSSKKLLRIAFRRTSR
jgi:hypothetical protein